MFINSSIFRHRGQLRRSVDERRSESDQRIYGETARILQGSEIIAQEICIQGRLFRLFDVIVCLFFQMLLDARNYFMQLPTLVDIPVEKVS
jgi:hypothetical protein